MRETGELMRTSLQFLFVSGLCLYAAVARADGTICTANVGAPPVVCDLSPTADSPQVTRDQYGVAHITAQTFYGLNFQIGVEDARDRLVQLEFFRRASKGTLAEVFGRQEIQADADTRTSLYTEEERQYFFSTLPCPTQIALQAYADGINSYITRIYRGRMLHVPHEFFNIGALVTLMTPNGLPGGATYRILRLGTENVFKPGPWTVTDSVAVGEMLVAEFGGGGGRQFRQLALRNYLTTLFTRRGDTQAADKAAQIFEDVRWIRDPNAPTTVPKTGAVNPVVTESGTVDTGTPEAYEFGVQGQGTAAADLAVPGSLEVLSPAAISQALADFDRVRDEIARRAKQYGVPRLHGSNSWAVTPTRSTNHQALLWGGPQEGFDTPNVNNEVYARTPELAFGGMKIPGAPAVLIGITDRFAWTTTSGEMDNSTVYVESLDPTRAPSDPQTADSQYYFLLNGSYQQMDRRVEVIHYAGEDGTLAPQYGRARRAPVAYNIFRVNDCDAEHFHGPVVSFDFSDPTHPHAFTVKTAYWKNETSTLEGFAEFDRATNFQEFDAAVAKVVSLHNFMYADYLGNIGYWSAGSKVNFPPGFDDRFPSDGTGSQEWLPNRDGTMYTPFSQLIRSVNPSQGYLVNWNTKPIDQPCVLEGNSHDEHWGEIYRSDRMAFLLAHNTNTSLDDIIAISKDIGTIDDSEDTVRPSAPYLVPFIDEAYANLLMQASPLSDPHTHPLLADALFVLNQWNNLLVDTAQIYPPDGTGHYNPAYSPSLDQAGMSILFQWWYAFKKNLFGGGVAAGDQFVGTVNFSDTSIDGSDYLGETTYNMALHILDGAQSGVPQQYTGDYFGGHRDEIIIESLNAAVEFLQGTGALPRLSYGTCSGNFDTPGFGTSDISLWGWQPLQDWDFDCLGTLTDPTFVRGTLPTHFGTAATQNRSTYMQAVSVSRPPQGVNVLAPGENATIRHRPVGIGRVGPHFGDQADLFRNFQFKPMMLP